MKSSRSFWLWVIHVAAVVGIVASGESILAHYSIVSSTFCTINATFNCDVVNKSEYSELFGIPVSVFGLIAYLAALLFSIWLRLRKEERVLTGLLLLAVGGFTFSLYLTSIEAFVLYTWCIVCLTSQASILAILIASLKLRGIDQPTQIV